MAERSPVTGIATSAGIRHSVKWWAATLVLLGAVLVLPHGAAGWAALACAFGCACRGAVLTFRSTTVLTAPGSVEAAELGHRAAVRPRTAREARAWFEEMVAAAEGGAPVPAGSTAARWRAMSPDARQVCRAFFEQTLEDR